ncbi:hypothetical protein LHJ74_19810 [Streptomyces sp. N2-109]|uniref:Integral membrane protein n=1 Tax=Streptomyces gossypii TaxID=2883101 RepID=A0ABT2JW32_9ACTN|nr:hypothetical protein [Streptomyces gossypii]MCT2592122.1 hypothetical protein [Streptomyces gossypii]
MPAPPLPATLTAPPAAGPAAAGASPDGPTVPAYAYPPPPPPGSPLGPPGRPGDSFVVRTLTGDWRRSFLAALWAPLSLLVSAVLLTLPLDEFFDENSPAAAVGDEIGWGERLQWCLAALLRGVGGGFELTNREGDAGMSGGAAVVSTISVVPLTVTALFVAMLWIGARHLRRFPASATAAMESTVRAGLLTGALTLLLALFSQPETGDLEVSTTPVLAALGALVLCLLVTGGVLAGPWIRARLSAQPGTGGLIAWHAWCAALRAVMAVLTLATVTVWVVLALTLDWSGTPAEGYVLMLLTAPNVGAGILGISWGAPLEYEGDSSFDSLTIESVGISELGSEASGWAAAGAVVGGVVCALLIGWLAGRLVRGSVPGQLLTGALSATGILLTIWAAEVGLTARQVSGSGFGDYESDLGGGSVRSEAGYGIAVEVLPLTVLWVSLAVLLIPYLMRALAQPTAHGYPPPGYGLPPGHGGPAGYGVPPGYAYPPTVYGQPPYGTAPPGYATPPPGYATPPPAGMPPPQGATPPPAGSPPPQETPPPTATTPDASGPDKPPQPTPPDDPQPGSGDRAL